MIGLGDGVPLYVATAPVDFRRGVFSLTLYAQEELGLDPRWDGVVVFRSKRPGHLKLLHWDGSGMVLVTKWLEAGGFVLPPVVAGVMRMSRPQLAALFDGCDWRALRRRAGGRR